MQHKSCVFLLSSVNCISPQNMVYYELHNTPYNVIKAKGQGFLCLKENKRKCSLLLSQCLLNYQKYIHKHLERFGAIFCKPPLQLGGLEP